MITKLLISVADFKKHIAQTLTEDDVLIESKLVAAQMHIERLLGFKIEDRFGGADQEAVPAPLIEAVTQLAAWWYEQRETALVGGGVQMVPFGVWDLVAEYREYSFG